MNLYRVTFADNDTIDYTKTRAAAHKIAKLWKHDAPRVDLVAVPTDSESLLAILNNVSLVFQVLASWRLTSRGALARIEGNERAETVEPEEALM